MIEVTINSFELQQLFSTIFRQIKLITKFSEKLLEIIVDGLFSFM